MSGTFQFLNAIMRGDMNQDGECVGEDGPMEWYRKLPLQQTSGEDRYRHLIETRLLNASELPDPNRT
jgi:hypothetical protein